MKKINLMLVLLMFAASVYYLPLLPDKIPMHWNINGQVDSYMTKVPAVWIMPIITLLVFVLFQFLPLIDPKKDKYKLFKREWEIIQTAIIGFFAYMEFLTFYISLHPQTDMLPLMFMGLGTLFVLMGNYLSKIRQNYFIGVKLPWTLSSEDNWNKTHRFASWCFVAIGIVTLAQAYLRWFAPAVILGGMILASLLPIIYSFLLFKKMQKKK